MSPSLIGGGTLDNANISCVVEEQGPKTPWKKFISDGTDTYDGGQMLCPNIDNVVICSNEGDSTERRAIWDGIENKLLDKGHIPVRSREATGVEISDFIPNAKMDIIKDPQFRNNTGQLMYAVAAANPEKVGTQAVPGTDAKVFGLFADSDGNDMHWEPIVDPNWILYRHILQYPK